MASICDGLAKYGIVAAPSPSSPSWLLILEPASFANEADLMSNTPAEVEVYVSEIDLMRADAVEVVFDKVGAIVGFPC